MENSMLDEPTDKAAELQEQWKTVLACAMARLRRTVEMGRGLIVEFCCGDVEMAAMRAELSSDLQTSLGLVLRAIKSNMRFTPTQPTRRHTLIMVSCLENLIEEKS